MLMCLYVICIVTISKKFGFLFLKSKVCLVIFGQACNLLLLALQDRQKLRVQRGGP